MTKETRENQNLIAAIDVGTNSFHLIVASVNEDGMLSIHLREKESVRLGSSTLKDMKKLAPDAVERGCEAMRNFSKLARSYNAEIHAAATSAVREADNRFEFIDRVKEETGVDVNIISGDEEGRLIYVGAIHSLPIYKKKALVIDIGGGSTETIVGKEGEILFVYSAKIGAIRISQNFFRDYVSTPDKVESCRRFIKGVWSPTLKRVKEEGFEVAVACSGTINTIVGIVNAMKGNKQPESMNGLSATKSELLEAIDKIVSTRTIEERANIPGMDPKRADIILGGALILERAIIDLDIKQLTLSNFALREGIVFDVHENKSNKRQVKNLTHLRYSSVVNLANYYRTNMTHCKYVREIALSIFDDLQSLHRLSKEDREMLEAAAILHDIGYFISHDKHHFHSHYLISQSVLPGFNNEEQELIALISRYHRKSIPKMKHPEFAAIDDKKKYKVRIMAGILRIAEGIDRRSMQLIKSAKAEIRENEIHITLHSDPTKISPDIELWGARRRTELLEDTLEREVKFTLVEDE